MSSKKKPPTTSSTSPQTLKIGSRVRCTDDGVEGRLIWANGVSVKIRWEDGEQVTWRRDSLAGRPIEIIEAAIGEDHPAAPDAHEQSDRIESPEATPSTPATEPVPAEQPAGPPPAEPTDIPKAVALEPTPAADTQVEEALPSEPAQEASTPPEQITEQPETSSVVAKQPRTRTTKKVADAGKEKKLGASG